MSFRKNIQTLSHYISRLSADYSYVLLMLLTLITVCNVQATNLNKSVQTKDQARGWLWYQDPALGQKPSIKPEPQIIQSPLNPQITPTPKTYQQQMDAQRQAFDEALAKSILEPTLDNVMQTQRMQAQILRQAGDFQKTWMAAETMTSPFELVGANPRSREMTAEQDQTALMQKIHAMSQDYGLFFLFQSSCPHCHAFAPVVKRFASQFNFELQGISGDGQGIAEFDSFLPDNGIGRVLNPQGIYPCLVLVNKRTRVTILLASALLNDGQLIDHMSYIIRYLEMSQHQKQTNAQG